MAKKILIVEDNELNMKLFRDLIEASGYETLETRNGLDVLDLARKHRPDLILMDIMMPVLDGYEAMRRIRAQSRFEKLPILALTAKAMREDRAKCIAVGANDYMTKPVDATRLLSTLRVWLYR